VSAGLRDELLALTRRPDAEIGESGFYVNRVFKFFGQEVRHCGYFPSWNLRFFRRGKAHYEDRLVHEHMIVDGPCGYLNGLLLHEDRRGLEHFFAKHNRYSTLEAIEIYEHPEPWPAGGVGELISNRTIRRRFGKSRILPHLPVPWLWRFVYMFVIRAGVLDGRAGWYLCWSISGYEMQVQFKYRELCRLKGDVPEVTSPAMISRGGLATREGESAPLVLPPPPVRPSPPAPQPPSAQPQPQLATQPARVAASPTKVIAGSDPMQPIPTVIFNKRKQRGLDRSTEDVVPEFTSPWTFKQNVIRALWMITTKLLFAPSFHNWYGWRRFLLRLFGAKVGVGVRVRPSAKVEIPWNIDLGDGSVVGDHAILYSLGKITVGRRSVVSQYTHLCAGTHDHTKRSLPLLCPPITIGRDAWVAADAFVGPGVTIGARTVVGARSNVFVDLPPDVIAVGSPAKAVRPREMIGPGLASAIETPPLTSM
jgi:putative colanic acid biosynthesis acetyltransferase WcaF